MGTFNREEEETINQLLYFLRDWGKYIIGLILVALVAYISSIAWEWHKKSEADKVAVIYAQYIDAVDLRDEKLLYQLTTDMERNYPSAEYTMMASIESAKFAEASGDTLIARKFLQFVLDNSRDNGLIDIARLRLADIYIDEHKFNLALRLLLVKPEAAFDALYHVKLGDLHVASGETNKAREAYKVALQLSAQNQGMSQMIQMRLDTLGGN